MLPITAYADRYSAAPGETVAFKVSSAASEDYEARLVRVISGDPNPAGPGVASNPSTPPLPGVTRRGCSRSTAAPMPGFPPPRPWTPFGASR